MNNSHFIDKETGEPFPIDKETGEVTKYLPDEVDYSVINDSYQRSQSSEISSLLNTVEMQSAFVKMVETNEIGFSEDTIPFLDLTSIPILACYVLGRYKEILVPNPNGGTQIKTKPWLIQACRFVSGQIIPTPFRFLLPSHAMLEGLDKFTCNLDDDGLPIADAQIAWIQSFGKKPGKNYYSYQIYKETPKQ